MYTVVKRLCTTYELHSFNVIRMSLRAVLIFTIFLIYEIKCEQFPKVSCNAVSNDTSVESFDITFHLSTTKSQETADTKLDDPNLIQLLKEKEFNPYNKTAIVVHGFLNNHKEGWMQETKNIFHNLEEVNVILIDWSNAFYRPNFINYRLAALSTEKVSENITAFLEIVATQIGTGLDKWSYLHFIGHSLGAHIAGQAARKLKKSGRLVDRITGLDPASPCFEKNALLRLNKADAKFVDVIHTNAKAGRNPNFGTYEPIGHVDFYPNGGNMQPHCLKGWFNTPPDTASEMLNLYTMKYAKESSEELNSTLNTIIKYVSEYLAELDAQRIIENYFSSDTNILCDHEAATIYFVNSLKLNEANNSTKLWANKLTTFNESEPIKVTRSLLCQNRRCSKNNECIEMGINAGNYSDARGVCYVDIIKPKIKCKRK